MDTLKLNGIEVECILGDLPEERIHEQKVFVDVALSLDTSVACESDDINGTIDYSILVGEIREALEEGKCRLMERAAAMVADVCLADPRVEQVCVTVRKTGTVPGLGSAEIVLKRPE